MERHEGEVVRIALLAGDDALVEGREFVDCDVRGPAVLVLLDGVRMDSNRFEGDLDALLWELDPAERPRVVGAVAVRSCSFVGCSFRQIGIAGPAELLTRFRNP